MKLSELTKRQLLRILRATERAVGSESPSVAVIRRELQRREHAAEKTPKGNRPGIGSHQGGQGCDT